MFSQSNVQISASLTNVRGLAVAAFDLVYCSLSVVKKYYLKISPTKFYLLSLSDSVRIFQFKAIFLVALGFLCCKKVVLTFEFKDQ